MTTANPRTPTPRFDRGQRFKIQEFGVNTKYVLGLPGATQIGLEHEEKNLRTMTTANPLTPPPSV